MKRIKFDNLQTNWLFISLILISIFCIIFGFFEIIEFENPKINKRISAIGYLSQAIFFSRMFWFKNYVQWNKKGIVVRIKSFFGKSISFENVKNSKLENNILTIYENNGKSYNFDLTEIDEKDSKKLNEIINKYCC
ncbi:hypothetical protein [Flavobacterium sp.]|jgi:hypothetical protein|uniref:hypothetical protein n=1 Tax=Flavobacterium sp. TaxID=239 RepID=UPI0035B2BD4F